jgi:hypothetical protein
MRLHGLGNLGMSDTDVLQPGTVISFNVTGDCTGVYESDIQNTLNNWAGQMMTVNSVTTNLTGYIPTNINVSVIATVINALPAGDLRGQIISALDALNNTMPLCPGVMLQGGVINLASGSTSAALTNPSTSNLFGLSTTTLLLAGVVGAFFLAKE